MKVPTAGQAQTDPRQTRAYRWVLGVGVTAIAVLGLVLLLYCFGSSCGRRFGSFSGCAGGALAAGCW